MHQRVLEFIILIRLIEYCLTIFINSIRIHIACLIRPENSSIANFFFFELIVFDIPTPLLQNPISF